MTAALRTLVANKPMDPDYTSLWPDGLLRPSSWSVSIPELALAEFQFAAMEFSAFAESLTLTRAMFTVFRSEQSSRSVGLQ